MNTMDFPYRSPEHAIRFAYRTESESIVSVSNYFADLRGSTVKLPWEQLSVWDRHTQAAYVLALLDRSLSPRNRLILRARYTIPASGDLLARKTVDCISVLKLLPPADRLALVHDTVREWAGLKRALTDIQWADHHDVSVREIRRIRLGNIHRPGIKRALNDMLCSAESAAADPLIDAGLVDAFVEIGTGTNSIPKQTGRKSPATRSHPSEKST